MISSNLFLSFSPIPLLTNSCRAAKRKVEASKREQQQLEAKIHNMTLDNDSATRSLKAIIKTKEELLITENFVRLDVKRLRDLLYRRADAVFSLESRKMQMRLSMEERQHGIFWRCRGFAGLAIFLCDKIEDVLKNDLRFCEILQRTGTCCGHSTRR